MSATALRGTSTHPQGDAGREPRSETRGLARHQCADLHPDVIAAARDLGIAGPRNLRKLQRLYDSLIGLDAEGFLAYLLAYADPTGEQATRQALLDQLTNHR